MDMTVIGVMSGTSYDAVDAAVADLRLVDDTLVMRPRGMVSRDMPPAMRDRIAACLPPARVPLADVCRLDTELGQLFGSVAAEANATLAAGEADLVVSHGQTVFHWVEDGVARGTLQLGSAAFIAEATGLPTVSDLRTRDIARGGQGAPLASTLDALLLLGDEPHRAALNLGGIANITLRVADAVIAYDIGPAGALIDAVVAEATNGVERMDRDGVRASAGRVDRALLGRLLADPYYALPAPKSTGKEIFHLDYVREAVAGRAIATNDLVATLTELTARIVADACTGHGVGELVVSGGGTRNPVLMRRIRELISPASLRHADEFGLPSQAKEALLCAVLGYLSVHQLPGTIATATGASAASVLGCLTPGTSPLRLPEPPATPPRRLVIADR